MRLGLSALIIGLSACSFEGGTATIDGGDSKIDAAPNDGNPSIDAPADLDTDGDGVVDNRDNCVAIENPNQENEDNDPFGNVCDVCPHLASDVVRDDDSDGVGDACDPQPGVMNTWLYFEGFDAPLVADDWVGEGNFTVDVISGELRSDDNRGRYYIRYDGFAHGEKVQVGSRMSFDNPLGPNMISFRYGGPVVREGTNLGNDNGCWVLRALSQGIEGYAFVESTAEINATVFTELALPDAPFNIEVTVDGNDYFCLFDPDGVAPTQLVTTSSANQGRNRIGVVSSFIETRVEYLFAISMQ